MAELKGDIADIESRLVLLESRVGKLREATEALFEWAKKIGKIMRQFDD